MKKTLIFMFIATLMFLFVSCSFESPEQPVAYTEKISVIIINIEKRQWFAGTIQREVTMTVYSTKYDFTDKVTERFPGTYMPYWDYEEGDVVDALLVTSIMQSTGELYHRYIQKVY